MQVTQAQTKAAQQMVDLIASRLGSGRAVHPETVISAGARLAGSLLLRSFKLNVPAPAPGAVVLSAEANSEGPQLIGVLMGMLNQFGVQVDRERFAAASSASDARAAKLGLLDTLALLQGDALQIAKNNGLTLKEAAWAAAMATAFLVKECASKVTPERGCSIAEYGFIEGCKTWPPTLGASPAAASPAKRPWYKLW